jgi:hypothetical protein
MTCLKKNAENWKKTHGAGAQSRDATQNFDDGHGDLSSSHIAEVTGQAQYRPPFCSYKTKRYVGFDLIIF